MTKQVMPPWLVKVIVSAVVVALVSGAGAWGAHLTVKSIDQEKKIGVLDEHQRGIDQSLAEIKVTQNRIEDKLDRVLLRGGK